MYGLCDMLCAHSHEEENMRLFEMTMSEASIGLLRTSLLHSAQSQMFTDKERAYMREVANTMRDALNGEVGEAHLIMRNMS